MALFILYNGVKTFRESLTPLLGTKPDKEFVDEITAAVEKYPDIVGTHDLIVHDYGVGNLIISMHAEVPMQMEFNTAHELVDMIEDELKKKYNCLVTIHMDPVAVNDERVMAVKAQEHRQQNEHTRFQNDRWQGQGKPYFRSGGAFRAGND